MKHARTTKTKQRIAAVAAIIAICALVAGGSLAYFTSKDTARNIITSGTVDVEIIEEDAQGQPYVDPECIMPGDTVDKVVYVNNIGKSDCWVRFKVEKTIKLAEGVVGEPDPSLIEINFDTENWTEQDGYWYYNKALSSDASTLPLFTTVTFNKAMGNLYKGCTATVDVKAYVVQAKNNGTTVFEAQGWPTDEGEE